ncbi:MAG: gliding motility-associated C-terminal domain-containing protein [Burkholderiales bacterium]|nr:gliding motility-associated C-terminal domain-containing protein [Bacteroidia bacterium]
MKKIFTTLLTALITLPVISFGQVAGTTCANPITLYPQTGCGNSSGAQYAGYYQMENAAGNMVAMTGTSTIDPTCTTDNETLQKVEWLEVTATATSFSINNQTNYTGGSGATAEKRDYVVYSGTCGSLTQVACFSEAAGSGGISAVTGLTIGQTYLIMVSQSSTAFAGCPTCTAVATCITSSVAFAPPNDACSGAYSLTTNVPFETTNANGTVDGPSVCQSPASGSEENNVWFNWCAPSTWPVGQTAFLNVNSQICNSTQGLQLSVFGANQNCAQLTAGTGTSIVCANPGITTNYSYTFTPVANSCYYVNIDGFAGTACTFLIMVGTSTVVCTPPTISVNTASICASGSATLIASGATSYTWSPATGLNTTSGGTVIASPSVTTVYTIIGSAAGCAATKTTTLTVNPTPTTTAITTGTITCSTPSVTLNSTLAGMSYTWTAPTSGSVTAANSQSTTAFGAPGTYTLLVKSAAGCTYSTTTSVTQNTLIPTGVSAGSNQTLTCASSSVTLTGSVTTPTNPIINWTGANVCGTATNVVTSVCGAGVYTLTATNPSNGCLATSTVQVFPSAGAPTVTNNPVTNTITCTNTLVSVSITTTASPVSYTWTGTGIVGATNTSSITVNQGGTFQYTVTNTSSGCSTSNNQVVVQNTTIPTSTATTTGTLTCATTTVALNSTLAGMNYTWTAPLGGSVGSANSQSTTASGAPGVYSLTVVNPTSGCTFTTTTAVTQNTTVPTTAASTTGTLTCITSTVGLNSTLAGMNYTWTAPSGGGVANPNAQSTTASGAAGIYSLTVVNPVNGCTFSTSTSVTQNTVVPTTTASTTGTLTCTTATVALNSTLGGMNYTWTAPSGGSVGSANTQSTTASAAAGIYSLMVVNPSTGCTFATTTSVTQNIVSPTTTASTTGSLTCSTLTVALNSTLAGMNYTWTAPAGGSVGSANTQSTTAFGIGGTYSLMVVNPSTGCTFATTTSVTQNTTTPATIASTTGSLTCLTTTVALNSTLAGMNYTWTAPSGGSVGSANTQSTIASGTSGTYSLMVLNPSTGCTFATTTAVTQNTMVPATTASTTGTLTCTTSTVALNSTLSGMNYTWTAPSGGSVASANTQSTTASGIGGTYSLMVVNPSTGCTFATTTSVAQNTVVPAGVSAGSNQTLTCASPSVTLTGTVATPTNATLNWTGPNVCGTATTAVTSACGAGVYTMTATNPINGCSASSLVQVFPSAGAPTVTNNPVTNTITCTNTLVTVSITTTATPVTYAWAGTGIVGTTTLSSVSVNQGGSFQYTVTNTSSGCSTSNNQVVIQNTTIPTTTASTTGTLTCSTTTVALNSTLANMTYTWTSPAGGSVGTANTQSTTASGAAGTYTIRVVNPANGCSFTATTAVTQNTAVPTTTASSTGTLTCVTFTAGLNSTLGGMNYTWTAPAGGTVSTNSTQATIASGAPGDYTLSVLNSSNGCTFTTTANVSQNTTLPTGVSAGPSQTLTCPSNSVTLTGSVSTPSNPIINWTGPSVCGTATTIVTSACSAGDYTLTVTDPLNGCSTSSMVTISPNAGSPTVTISSSALVLDCINAAQSVTVTSTPNTNVIYSWSPAPSSLSASGNIATFNTPNTYTSIVTNTVSNCSTPVQVIVTQSTSLPITVASSTGTLTCVTSTVDLNSTLGGMNYTWTPPSGGSVSTNSTQATVASGAPGDYTLTVLDPSNGCTYTTTANVTQNIAQPTGVSAGPSQTLTCPANSVTLTGSAGTPTNPIINWTGLNVCGTATTISTSACAAGDYTLTVTDPLNGCSSSSMATIFPNAGSPSVTISSPTLVIDCINAAQSVTVTSSPNINVTYNWNAPPSSLSASGSIATFNTPNTYICTVTNTLSGCSTPVQVVVSQNTTAPSLTITGSQTLTCAAPNATISVNTNPTSGLTYVWTGTLISGQGNDSVVVNQAGTYSVMVTNATNGCTNTASSQVIADTNVPVATISVTSTNSIITCQNTSVTLTASVTPLGTYSYTWSPSGGNGAVATVTSPNLYSVMILNQSSGCLTSAQITITGNTTLPSVTVNNATIACGSTAAGIGGSAITSATNASYSWSTSGTGTIIGGSTSTPTINAAGIYVVTVTDNDNGCTNTGTVNVSQTIVTAAFTANPISGTAPLDVNFNNQSTGATSYSWNFGDASSLSNTSSATNPAHIYNTIGTYTVILTALNGACTSTAAISIEVLENSSIIVPNVFTPNGDHSNDVFKITSTGLETLNCDIFNRWGLKLFTISSPNDSWDGGGAVDGTYFFILKAKGYDGKEYTEKGNINIFR